MTRRMIALGALAVLPLSACSGQGDGGGGGPAAPVTIAFGGDVHFEGDTLSARLDDPATALGPIKDQLAKADLAMVNLETAVTERGTPAPGKQYTFRTIPAAFDALKDAGVDVATMANNHGLDYGPDGLTDSLAAAKAKNFPVVGIGATAADAFKPYVAKVKNSQIAFFGATQVLDDNLVTAWTATDAQGGLASAKDPARLVAAVKEAAAKYDTVVVDLHWGVELQSCPSAAQKTLAQQLVDAGADAVVGSHAHVLEAGGFLKSDKYVHYGLGNFVFYSANGPSAQSGVLTLTVSGHSVKNADWAPAVIQNGIPQPLTGAQAQNAYVGWQALAGCAGFPQQTS
jgi:poly-gamma-glutamate capsule biosynthesis protein CapA/YwtB (metallophosphatase superfamily)